MALTNTQESAPWDMRIDQGSNWGMTVTDGPQDVYTPEIEWYDDQINYFVRHRGIICQGCPADVYVVTQVIWDIVTQIGCGETRIERDGQH